MRYDIYGKDVLIANKMETNGIEGNICVSETTKELLDVVFPRFFGFEKHKEVFLNPFNEKVNSYKIIDLRNEN